MNPRPLGIVALALGIIGAAGVGSYLALRPSQPPAPVAAAAQNQAGGQLPGQPATTPAATSSTTSPKPVTETEGTITPDPKATPDSKADSASKADAKADPKAEPVEAPKASSSSSAPTASASTANSTSTANSAAKKPAANTAKSHTNPSAPSTPSSSPSTPTVTASRPSGSPITAGEPYPYPAAGSGNGPNTQASAANGANGGYRSDRPAGDNQAKMTPSAGPSPVEQAPSEAPAPPKPRFEELLIPADSVIGLRLDDTISSEFARVEDRVEARVSRDVRVNGEIAVPAGTRARGNVVLVEGGGKFKERARLGVRFHTLVLADGSTIPIQTETIYREGQEVAKQSATKIGAGAAAGALIGAIFGGGKGAAIGGAAGAGAGSAATAMGPRSQATLTAGSTVTVRLSNPATVTIEK